MNVLFEDDGQLKAGTLLADHDASLQVEAVSGKRQKIKASHVLLRFPSPSPAETMAKAQEIVADIDPNFLWEVSADDEFGFDELAREYYGGTPAPAESAAVALALSRAGLQRRSCRDGAGQDETRHLAYAEEIVDSGRTQAERLLERYHGAWGGSVKPAFTEYVF